MATRNPSARWYWPKLENLADAVQASNQGMWAAVFCAAVTALFATIAIFANRGIAGIGPSAFVDALLFALVAWRIRARSRAFAVAGLCLFVIEKAFQVATQPQSLRFGFIVAILLLLAFVSGVRGTFAYHRLVAEEASTGPLAGAEGDA